MTGNFRDDYHKVKLKAWYINLSLIVLLFCGFVLALCIGKYPVSPLEAIRIIGAKILIGVDAALQKLFSAELFGVTANWDSMTEQVIFGLRLPRILASVCCGAALSLSGATYQSTFKNPLVSPDFLGVSSGACIGAAIAIILMLPPGYVQLFAFAGGLLAVFLTISIPYLMRSESNIMLVLSGIIVGGLMGSLLGFLKYIADPTTALVEITYWQMGSFSYIKMFDFLSILPTMILPAIALVALSWRLNILSMGESEAKTLGASVVVLRNACILCATLLTASAVCVSGTIGWVGLVIPHFARMLIGPDNRKMIPAACIIGGLFLLLVDTITRTVGTAELPISILTGVVGAPFYAWLLYRQRSRLR